MSLYTPEEIAALKANPATAALGDKLEKDIFIPKDRMDEINTKAKTLQEQLDKYTAEEAKRAEELKKASEAKAVEDGKSKELLAQKDAELAVSKKEKEALEIKAKAFEDQQKKIRDGALSKIKDPEMKKIAEALSDVQMVVDFVDKLEKTKPGTFTDKSKSPGSDGGKPAFKNLREAETYYREQGLAQ